MAGNANLGFASETSGLEQNLNKTSGLEGPGIYYFIIFYIISYLYVFPLWDWPDIWLHAGTTSTDGHVSLAARLDIAWSQVPVDQLMLLQITAGLYHLVADMSVLVLDHELYSCNSIGMQLFGLAKLKQDDLTLLFQGSNRSRTWKQAGPLERLAEMST